MIYSILRIFTRWAFLAFFRRIYCHGRRTVPKGIPLIFTPNHPTAFIEPCFLACFSGRTMHFLTRGDVFINPVVRWLLRLVHLIPIYRFHDGFSNLRKNDHSLSAASKVLSGNGCVLIMAEGGMRHEKRLRPIRKGAARLAFDTMEQYNLPELAVQPIAVNYTYAELPRKESMISIRPPIYLSKKMEKYREDPKAAIEALTQEIHQSLASRVIHIEHSEDEKLTEQVLRFCRPAWKDQSSSIIQDDNDHRLLQEKQIAEKIAVMDSKMKQLLHQLFINNEALPLKGSSPTKLHKYEKRYDKLPLTVFVIRMIRYIAGIFHWLPYRLTTFVTDRTGLTIEFRSSVFMVTAMIVWPIWWLILSLSAGLIFGWMASLMVLFVLVGWFILWIIADNAISMHPQTNTKKTSFETTNYVDQSKHDAILSALKEAGIDTFK